jgi:hypothetical protein
MMRGGATLNFSCQICQAEIGAIRKIFRRSSAASVHSTVDVVDNNTSFLQKRTYPQLWIIFSPLATISARTLAPITRRRRTQADFRAL